ncbi:ImmA/IrrE family metallo-endopeptidase [Paenibacillus xylanexedens]|uniref:helix-turn-helix domain-containing protein n=1 Tax=Paenibacillus xylanexedens TaxID=528191 RepID=UPI001F326C3F|nr:XRE family transcriptional regulator [Paenibacillus xylanexedens]MCF7754780.1 ImmA/IrrE family metallo-endopeptidase [Paenibacillus xylanexedens]
MSFDYKLLGEKLKEARQNQEYTIDEVAEYINKSEKDYKMIEYGEYVTLEGDTVVLLSKLFKIDFRYLVTGNYPSAESQITSLFRQNSELSKNDRRAIQSFIRLCETKNDIEEMLGHYKHEPPKYSMDDFNVSNHKEQGILAAELERKRLKIVGNITNVYSLLRQQRIHIFRRTLDDKNISGVYIKHPYAGHCILINYVDDIFRQNFSVAHEYCHVIFDSDSEQRISYEKANDYIEVRANNFSSNFLVPSSAYHELINNRNISYEYLSNFIIAICRKYKVNKQVVIYKLSDLKIITSKMKNNLLSDFSFNVINNYKEDPELVDVSPNLVKPITELIRNGISLEYIMLCKNAYDNGMITFSKLVNSLHTDFYKGKQIADIMDFFMEV